GDSSAGGAGSPFSSVEKAAIGPYGTIGPWKQLPNSLNSPRDFAAATSIGRYVYVIGGSDGASPLTSAERTMILDPAEVPLATVSGATLTYADTGSAVPGSAKPQPLGSLGNWRVLPAMASGRQGLAAATAIDPVSATTHYVYALLGKSGPVTALTSYEYLTV